MNEAALSSDRPLARRLFILTFVAYAWFFGGGGWNQNATLDLARAIVERGQIDIGPYASNTGDLSYANGKVYANKAPGLGLLAVPPYALASLFMRGAPATEPVSLTLAAWIATVAVCGLAGALIPALLYLEGRRRGKSRPWSVAVALAIGLGTPLFAFSTVLFPHVPSAMLLLAATLLVIRGRRPVLAGFLLGIGAATNYLLVPPMAILLVVPLVRRSWRDAVRFALGTLPPIATVAVYQLAAFGSPFRTSIDTMDPRFVSESARWLGVFDLPQIDALLGITVSPYRGLFWASPVLLLALVGGWRLWQERRELATLACAVAISLFFLVVNASFNGWEAGFSFGPRYLLPIVPLLGLLLLEADRIPRWIFMVLLALSLSHNAVAVAVDPQPSGSIADPLFSYLYPTLIRGRVPEGLVIMPQWPSSWIEGRVAVNPHTVDQAIPFTRHAPGSPPSLWASFNLGELIFGVGSGWSILPILVWCAAGWWWISRRDRPRNDSRAEHSSPGRG